MVGTETMETKDKGEDGQVVGGATRGPEKIAGTGNVDDAQRIRVVGTATAHGADPRETRSSFWLDLLPEQRASLDHAYEMCKVRMRLETAGENVKELQSRATAFEKKRKAVPQSLSKFIADAEEREAVAWARIQFNDKSSKRGGVLGGCRG